MGTLETMVAALVVGLFIASWLLRWNFKSFFWKRAREDGMKPVDARYVSTQWGRDAGKDYIAQHGGEERLKKIWLGVLVGLILMVTLIITFGIYNG